MIDVSVVSPMIQKLKLEDKVKISHFSLPKASHVGFSKNNPFQPLFEKGFQAIQDNGTYRKILDRWEMP